MFVVAVNRTGFEPVTLDDPDAVREGRGIQFWGSSFIAGPDGQILGQLAEDEEGVLVVEADLSDIEGQRQGWPFLRDRRVDAYGEITSRYGR